MNIVIEGPDNSGKSTLAVSLSAFLGWPIQPSEGPERYPGEMEARCLRYLNMYWTIFDRHPCISQSIYGLYRGDTLPDATAFYRSNPFIIYCPGDGLLTGHVIKAHDSEDHLKMLDLHHRSICEDYDRWAIARATWIQRKEDSYFKLIDAIRGIARC